MKKFIPMILLFATAFGSFAQNKFANTVSYDSISGSPKASLDDVSWVSGHWRGEAFGGITEEVWVPPLGESMMFVFKLVKDGKVSFYETGGIIEQDGSLILRLKHFDGAFHGWEAKNETVDFPLVKLEDNKVYFDEFTMEKVSDDEINVYVVISHGKESEEEVKFNYKKVK